MLKTLWNYISTAGIDQRMKPYERRRAIVFNRVNCIAMLLLLVRLGYMALFSGQAYTGNVILVNTIPLLISAFMMFCMMRRWYITAVIASFLLYPPAIALACLFTGGRGLEWVLLLYCYFSFFFLHRLFNIITAFTIAAASLLVTQFVHLPSAAVYHDPVLSIINFTAVFIIIFATLFHVKQELHDYEMEITGQKQLMEELNHDIMAQQAELYKQSQHILHKNQEITGLNNIRNKLISIMSHDLKTPVYGLRNIFRHVQPANPDSGEVLRAMVPQINTELDNTISLIENLLAWSKQNIATVTGAPSEIDINRITNEVITFLSLQASQKGITLKNDIENPAFAWADKEMVKTVLRNLVSNAIKFTPENGLVRIYTELSARFVLVNVEDNGVGIPEHRQATLFGDDVSSTPGTSNEQGTGLGLMICRDLVEQNGGDITFYSEEGKGTLFTFSVPLNEASFRKQVMHA